MSHVPHPMTATAGLHHITCLAGDPQENLDFYAGTLGMRLVKRSINQDDPSLYHLFYADGEGRPGTDLTFFPVPDGRPGQDGTGLFEEVALAVPPDSLPYWRDRLREAGHAPDEAEDRFGEPGLALQDPHGLALVLVAAEAADERPFTPWERGPVPREHQVRGLHAARLVHRDADPALEVAREALGMEPVDEDGPWTRLQGTDPLSGYLEVRSAPERDRGRMGQGIVHHVAFRAADGEAQGELRERLRKAGLDPTGVVDRHWFESVYARDPGGALWEVATDGPGFTVDEAQEELGESLVLPPWMEGRRGAIEGGLAGLTLPYGDGGGGG